MSASGDLTLDAGVLAQGAFDAAAALALNLPVPQVVAETQTDAATASASAVADASAAAATAAGPTLVDLQGFAIGPHRFLVNYLDAIEIEEVGQLTRVPAAPAWMAGLVNLHGNVLAAFDLHSLLGGARAAPVPGALPMLLVLRHRRDRVAILIDGMTRRMRFDVASAQSGNTTAPFYGPHIVRAFSASDGAAAGINATAGMDVIETASATLWHELDFVSLIDGLSAVEV